MRGGKSASANIREQKKKKKNCFTFLIVYKITKRRRHNRYPIFISFFLCRFFVRKLKKSAQLSHHLKPNRNPNPAKRIEKKWGKKRYLKYHLFFPSLLLFSSFRCLLLLAPLQLFYYIFF